LRGTLRHDGNSPVLTKLLGNPILADVEVLNAALGLRAPVTVGRHFQRSQAVERPAAPVCSTTNGAANHTHPTPLRVMACEGTNTTKSNMQRYR
jgi:hypothetical protein